MRNNLYYILTLCFLFSIVWATAQTSLAPTLSKADAFLQKEILQKSSVSKVEKNTNNALRLIVELNDPKALNRLKNMGAIVHTSVDRFHTIQIDRDRIGELGVISGIERLYLGQKMQHSATSLAVENVQAHRVHAGENPLPRAYTGKGIVLGVIDTGVDFKHEDFRDPFDPSKSRISYIWDQTVDDGPGTNPDQFVYGREWTKKDIENEFGENPMGLVTHLDSNRYWGGHGTHVLSTAGGNNGLAPEADLIMVASDLGFAEIIDGVRYIVEKAQELDKPCVINMSFGGNLNPHDGTDILSTTLDFMMENTDGLTICAAAGNSGESLRHWGGFDLTEEPSVMYGTGINNLGLYFRIPKEYVDSISLSVAVDSAFFDSSRGDLLVPEKLIGQTEWMTIQELVDRQSGIPLGTFYHGDGSMAGEVFAFAGEELDYFWVLMEIDDGIPTIYDWELRKDMVDLYRIQVKGSGSFHAWMSAFFPIIIDDPAWHGYPTEGFVSPDTKFSISAPSDARNIISVGAYTNQQSWTNIDQNVFNVNQEVGSLADFSSRGPTFDGRIKPDITAPGKAVIAAVSSEKNNFYNRAILIDESPRAVYSGTSMATPVVAGAVALLLEHNPFLDFQEIRDLISRTAVVDDDVTAFGMAPNNGFGYGKLNVFEALLETISLTNTQEVDPTRDRFLLSLFPNPANEQLNLRYTLPEASVVELRISNAIGQEIHVLSDFYTRGNYDVQLDITNWASGWYTARISDGRSTSSKVFIKK
ncbi:MAG: S8/S53 family peptidase [Bacteroidota bacterium]